MWLIGATAHLLNVNLVQETKMLIVQVAEQSALEVKAGVWVTWGSP